MNAVCNSLLNSVTTLSISSLVKWLFSALKMAISKPLRFGPSSIFLVNRWILEPSTSFDIDNEEPSKNKNQWKFKEITMNLLPERVFPRWTSLCWDAPILHRLSINCFKCSTSHSGFTYKVNVSKKMNYSQFEIAKIARHILPQARILFQ